MLLTLGQASKQVGVSKPTLSKAISSSKLSAVRREDGSWAIDPAELQRYVEANKHRFQKEIGFETGEASRLETSKETSETPIDSLPINVVRRILEAESAVEKHKIYTQELDKRVAILEGMLEDMRGQRDGWQQQAERALLMQQQQHPAEQAASTPPARGGLFGWMKRA